MKRTAQQSMDTALPLPHVQLLDTLFMQGQNKSSTGLNDERCDGDRKIQAVLDETYKRDGHKPGALVRSAHILYQS